MYLTTVEGSLGKNPTLTIESIIYQLMFWRIDTPFVYGTFVGSNVFSSITDSTTEPRLKYCIENEECKPTPVVITTEDECSLLNERYTSSITINSGTSTKRMCKNLESFVISDYPNLETITIGDYVFNSYPGLTEVTIEKCPKLESISIGQNCLGSTYNKQRVFTLSGIMMLFGILSRSWFIYNIRSGKWRYEVHEYCIQ